MNKTEIVADAGSVAVGSVKGLKVPLEKILVDYFNSVVNACCMAMALAGTHISLVDAHTVTNETWSDIYGVKINTDLDQTSPTFGQQTVEYV